MIWWFNEIVLYSIRITSVLGCSCLRFQKMQGDKDFQGVGTGRIYWRILFGWIVIAGGGRWGMLRVCERIELIYWHRWSTLELAWV